MSRRLARGTIRRVDNGLWHQSDLLEPAVEDGFVVNAAGGAGRRGKAIGLRLSRLVRFQHACAPRH
jgi:hypothetical protein